MMADGCNAKRSGERFQNSPSKCHILQQLIHAVWSLFLVKRLMVIACLHLLASESLLTQVRLPRESNQLAYIVNKYFIGYLSTQFSDYPNPSHNALDYSRCALLQAPPGQHQPLTCRRLRLAVLDYARPWRLRTPLLITTLMCSLFWLSVLRKRAPLGLAPVVTNASAVLHHDGQTCVIRALVDTEWEASPEPLKCHQATPNWLSVSNDTVHVTAQARASYGAVSCRITPFVQGADDFEVLDRPAMNNVRDHMTLVSDFFTASCRSGDGRATYTNLHSTIVRKKSVKSLPIAAQPLNVLMVGYDTMSRVSWIHNLAKTHKYFVDVLGGSVMEGYNIVGDGTPQALLPILTGKNEEELPEARRGHEGAQPINGHPWIWKAFKARGYVTQYGEDSTLDGTFTYRMLGFKQQPVDHYMHTFYMRADKDETSRASMCLGSVSRHANMLRYAADFYDVYRDTPKFSFMFHGEYSHGSSTRVQLADDELLEFLQRLQARGDLDNTLLVMMADHGPRFSKHRRSITGKYQERLPYVGVRFPPSFVKKHPAALRNLRDNVVRLTTPYDIHATFEDILAGVPPRSASPPRSRGYSLLQAIPRDRTCSQAGIEPHWCSCMDWQEEAVTSILVRRAAQAFIDSVNNLTQHHRALCQPLRLVRVHRAVSYAAGARLASFAGNVDPDGRVPKWDAKPDIQERLYQLNVETAPGKGLFDMTVTHLLDGDKFTADVKYISRLNAYGSQPDCVASKFPHLRKYCYCFKQK